MAKRYYTGKEICELAGVTPEKLKDDIKDRYLRIEKIGDDYFIPLDLQCNKYIKHQGDRSGLWQWKKPQMRGSHVQTINNIIIKAIKEGKSRCYLLYSPSGDVIGEYRDINIGVAYKKAVEAAVANQTYVEKALYSRDGHRAIAVALTMTEYKYLLTIIPDILSNKILRAKLKRRLKKGME